MAYADSCVTLHEHQRHGLADDIAGSDNNDVLSR